ncbi:MAG TPA: hypothetical protein VK422_22225 [Pyrinomonadaceae bacterium]|nr:hypothetical protein [Pyrinomonadaceae bacterium]
MRFKLHTASGMKKRFAPAAAALLCVVAAAFSSQGQTPSPAPQQNEDAARARAEQVLKQAREATRAGLKGAEIKSLFVKSVIETSLNVPQMRNKKIRGTTDEELSVSLPDKLRTKGDANYTTNQEISEWVINGDRVSSRSDVLVDGTPVNFIIKSQFDSDQKKIATHKNYVFTILFPVIFDSSWYPVSGFRHVGIAEANGTKADVIETTSPTAAVYRLFFDQQTHLLLLLSEKWVSEASKKERERKHFFSDYRKADGLLAAHKIVVEENGEVVEERVIKRLQINPAFGENFFAVKGK